MTNIDNNFIKQLSKMYLSNGFAQIAKRDIDILVFNFFATKILLKLKDKNIFLPNKQINYMALDKLHIHEIAMNLKITDRKATNMLQQSFLNFAPKTQKNLDKQFFQALYNNLSIYTTATQNLKNGEIKIFATNPIFKAELETRLSALGAIVDYAKNKNILIVQIHWLIQLLGFRNPKDVKRLLQEFAKQAKLIDTEKRELIKILNKKTTKQIIQSFTRDILEKTGGKIATIFFDMIFEHIK